MPVTDKELKELWIAWTHDALVGYTRPEDIDKDDIDGVVNDMVDISTKYADLMCDVYEETFVGAKKTRSRRRKRKVEEDDDDDDLDDEDDG